MFKNKKASRERGAAHLILVLVFVLGLVGALGFVGYNSWQRQHADAASSSSVGRIENKIKNIQAKIVKQGKALEKDQGIFKEQRAVTIGIGNWLSKGDLSGLTPPTDAKDLEYFNTAVAIKAAQKTFWAKFNADKANNPDLVAAYEKRLAARTTLQEARVLRDKAVDELAALIEQDKDGKNDSASAAINAARERKQKAQSKVDRLKATFQKENEPFAALVTNWPEYVALQTARKELEAAWDKRVELRDSIVEHKKTIRDLRVELQKAKKALEEAKKKRQQANQNSNSNGNNNGGNNGNGGNSDQPGGKTCPSGSQLNSSGTACYYISNLPALLRCHDHHYEYGGKCYKDRHFSPGSGNVSYSGEVKGYKYCREGSYDGSLNKCVVTTKTF